MPEEGLAPVAGFKPSELRFCSTAGTNRIVHHWPLKMTSLRSERRVQALSCLSEYSPKLSSKEFLC